MATGKSIVWHFFKVSDDDDSKVQCNLCPTIILRGAKRCNYNTSNMFKHLNAKHRKELDSEKDRREKAEEEIKEKEKKRLQPIQSTSISKKKKFDTDASKQLKLHEVFDRKKIWDINDIKAKSIHKYIGEMIAIDLQPFSVVEDLGFIRLMKHICPNYQLPSRKYIKENIVIDIYEKIKAKIKTNISEANYISLTSDGWTSASNSSFLSVTSHWIDENMDQQTAILRVAPMLEAHTAANISNELKETLQQFDIPQKKIHLLVRDNAANMAAAAVHADFESLPCFLHSLQLTINDAIFTQRYVLDILAICRQIVGHFKHSPAAFAKYQQYQKQLNIPEHTFVQDITTRWNSQYYMLSRIYEQKNAIISYCSDHPKPNCLENNQWKIVEKLIKILVQFVDCTNLLSSSKSYASSIIPHIKVFSRFFEIGEQKGLFSGLGTTLSAWKASFKKRYVTYLDDKNLILATYLDPRYKARFFDSEYEKMPMDEVLTRWLHEDTKTFNLIDDSKDQQGANILTDSSDNSIEEETDGTFNFSFSKCFSSYNKKKEENEGAKNTKPTEKDEELQENSSIFISLKQEMNKYNSLKVISNENDPLQWWKACKNEYPLLTPIVKKYLSAPPSSVESERVFSIGGNVYMPKRNRLSGETGEMLMFLHYNLRALGLKYD